jgi:hypothetical protein
MRKRAQNWNDMNINLHKYIYLELFIDIFQG